MIRAQRLRDFAARDGVRPEEVEKEYLQHAFLHSWAAEPDGLVFRGGTMMRIVHGHPRYSEDLDFVRMHTTDEAEASLEAALKDLTHWGLQARYDAPQRSGQGTIVWPVRFRGPLYPETGSWNRIKLQAGSTNDHDLPPEHVTVATKYDDVPLFVIPVQDRRETAAEKVRALVERDQARDVYDLYHLVQQGFSPEQRLVARKLRWEHGYPPRTIQPHKRQDYERDLELWVPRRARVPWQTAWAAVRQTLAGLECIAVDDDRPP